MSDTPRRLGGPSNNWLYHPSTGYDLTRSHTPRLRFTTTTSQSVTICPSTTAMIVIDMQNLFLDPAAGRPLNPLAHAAEKDLLEVGLPACRSAGIQVVHLTWGVSEEELDDLPPVLVRNFGTMLEGDLEDVDGDVIRESFGVKPTVGEDIGDVKLENGTVTPGGRLLMRDEWNTAIHPPLQADYDASQATALPDVRFHKSRIAGMWSDNLPIVRFLRDRGFKTLLFTGVNTDQCVFGSLQDAASMGFDAVLLRDGCATASPDYARKMAEFNCRKGFGFVSSCEALAEGVKNMNRQ